MEIPTNQRRQNYNSKRPTMLRKHHKFRQGDKVRNFDVSLNLLLTPKQKSLESPYPYNISVMQQRFLLVKLGYLQFIIWQNSIYIRKKKKMEYIWNTSWKVRTYGIYVRISVVSEIKSDRSAERVRFLIQNNEYINTVQSTFHVVLCLFIYTY